VLDVVLLVGDLEAVADLGGVDEGDEGLGGTEEAGVDQGPGGMAGLTVQVELADGPDRCAVPVDDGQRPPAVEGRRVEGRHGLPPCVRQSTPLWPRPPSLPSGRFRLTGQSRRTTAGYGTAGVSREPTAPAPARASRGGGRTEWRGRPPGRRAGWRRPRSCRGRRSAGRTRPGRPPPRGPRRRPASRRRWPAPWSGTAPSRGRRSPARRPRRPGPRPGSRRPPRPANRCTSACRPGRPGAVPRRRWRGGPGG